MKKNIDDILDFEKRWKMWGGGVYDAIKAQGLNDELLIALFILCFINISVRHDDLLKSVKRGNDSVFFYLSDYLRSTSIMQMTTRFKETQKMRKLFVIFIQQCLIYFAKGD